MFKNLKNSNHGVVFVTVLIIIIVAMALTVSILSLNISQIKSSEEELRYIQAKTLADGVLSQMIADQFNAVPAGLIADTEVVGDTTFTMTGDFTLGPSPGLSQSVPYTIDAAFAD